MLKRGGKIRVKLKTTGAIGISGMMHGHLVFDKSGKQLQTSAHGETPSRALAFDRTIHPIPRDGASPTLPGDLERGGPHSANRLHDHPGGLYTLASTGQRAGQMSVGHVPD